MGVHTTFVRSVDLDEWTQSQIDAMRLGGNGNARQFFRKHGFSDFHGKIEKKYKSKGAQAYRSELDKLVKAEAAKRGEGAAAAAAGDTADSASALLNNLDLREQSESEQAAKDKLAAARSASAAPAQPKAKLASQLPGAKGRLTTPPSSGNAPTIVLRKPAGSTSNVGKNLLKKKPSGAMSSRLRVNKLSTSTASDDEGFEDVEATQKKAAEAEKEAKQVKEDEAMARKLQQTMNGNGAAPTLNAANTTTVPPPKPAAPALTVNPPANANPKELDNQPSSMEAGVARLKAMNSDFFADM